MRTLDQRKPLLERVVTAHMAETTRRREGLWRRVCRAVEREAQSPLVWALTALALAGGALVAAAERGVIG